GKSEVPRLWRIGSGSARDLIPGALGPISQYEIARTGSILYVRQEPTTARSPFVRTAGFAVDPRVIQDASQLYDNGWTKGGFYPSTNEVLLHRPGNRHDMSIFKGPLLTTDGV